ncbi:MAG: type II toxin-antitoxin system RelE/ParE family toxin [Candidatus Dormibacteria bacterium]|jgi:mRNA interferase RelE/StbE
MPSDDPPPWTIQIRAPALKTLRRLSRPDRERIRRAIDRLPLGDVRQLENQPGAWRLRVGDWRVRYRLDVAAHVVDVTAVAPRGSAYKP